MIIYHLRQIIRDIFLYFGNPGGVFKFSPQHEKLIEYGPYKEIIHVGANIGQELSLYNYLQTQKVYWVEADDHATKILRLRCMLYRKINHVIIKEFLSDLSGKEVNFYKFSKSGANSMFEPTEEFLKIDRKRYVIESTKKTTLSFEDMMNRYELNFPNDNNLLVLDVQGNEKSILKGISTSTIAKFRIIMCEFSIGQYDNGVSVDELDIYITNLGFKKVFGPIRSSDDAIYERIDSHN